MSDKIYLDWDEIEEDLMVLIDQIETHPDLFNGILVVTRGGLAPAAYIAQHLDIKHIDTIGLESYHDERQGEVTVIKEPSDIPDDGNGWLIVDELVDTGATAEYLQERFPASPLAVLYTKPGGESVPDYAARHFEENSWIVFPWETDAE